MAPTTMLGQKSTTTQQGRGKNREGPPIKVCELLSSLDGVTYLERVAVSTPKDVTKAKKAIKKAFQNQIDGKGFSLIEVLSMCPIDWKLTPAEAEVGVLLLKGLSHRDVAGVRSTSERTVREQARSLYRKASLAGRSELSAFFLEDLLLPMDRRQSVAITCDDHRDLLAPETGTGHRH